MSQGTAEPCTPTADVQKPEEAAVEKPESAAVVVADVPAKERKGVLTVIEDVDQMDPEVRKKEANKVYWALVVMELWIGFNHGAISSGLKLASSVLGTDLGGDAVGTLCVVYTFTALFAAGPIVQVGGEKWSLVAALFLYSFYLAGLLFALYCNEREDPELEDAAPCARYSFMTGAVIGGFAAGFYFTAQDAYFATCTTLYSELSGQSIKDVSSHFSAICAGIYLFFDLACKLFSFIILETTNKKTAETTLFIVLTLIGVGTSIGMISIPKLRQTPKLLPTLRSSMETLRMTIMDPVILLFTPFDFTFGLFTSYIGNIVNARVIKVYLGTSYVSLMGALTSGMAAIGSYPFDWLTRKTNSKLPGLMIGAMLFLCEGIIYLVFKPADLGTWPIVLTLVAIAGFSRSTIEGPRKAIIADAYDSYSARSCAFSALVVHDGISSSIGFFYFSDMVDAWGVNGLSWINIGFSILAIVCLPGMVYFANKRIAANREKKAAAENTSSSLDIKDCAPFGAESDEMRPQGEDSQEGAVSAQDH
ncbi:hypothetical protein DIPPA_23258 [Diplonema papillatum]|nr:hypothetical protein DIPPA_23258 [Diplonema papillatum]